MICDLISVHLCSSAAQLPLRPFASSAVQNHACKTKPIGVSVKLGKRGIQRSDFTLRTAAAAAQNKAKPQRVYLVSRRWCLGDDRAKQSQLGGSVKFEVSGVKQQGQAGTFCKTKPICRELPETAEAKCRLGKELWEKRGQSSIIGHP